MRDIQNITKLMTSFEIILDFIENDKILRKERIESLRADIKDAQDFIHRLNSVPVRKVMSAIDEDSL